MHLQRGDDITKIRPWLNALADKCDRNRVTVEKGSGLTVRRTPGGTVLGAQGQQLSAFWGKVTAVVAGATYTVVQQQRSGGAWVNGSLTVQATEVNGNTTVPTAGANIEFVWYESESNEYLFEDCST